MDTKALHDSAINAGIDLRNEDSWSDCIEPWTILLLETPEAIVDVINDFLLEVTEEPYADNGRFDRMSRNLVQVRRDSDYVRRHMKMSKSTNIADDHLVGTYMSCVVDGHQQIGQYFTILLLDQAEKFVANKVEEWWADVVGYAADMNEGMAEDYADWRHEDARDRALEER